MTLRRQQERKLVGAARDDVWWCGKKETDAAVHCRASASAPAPALSRATSLFSPATHANFGAREITVNDHLLTFNDIAVGYEKVVRPSPPADPPLSARGSLIARFAQDIGWHVRWCSIRAYMR